MNVFSCVDCELNPHWRPNVFFVLNGTSLCGKHLKDRHDKSRPKPYVPPTADRVKKANKKLQKTNMQALVDEVYKPENRIATPDEVRKVVYTTDTKSHRRLWRFWRRS